jgi:hypothetical protein
LAHGDDYALALFSALGAKLRERGVLGRAAAPGGDPAWPSTSVAVAPRRVRPRRPMDERLAQLLAPPPQAEADGTPTAMAVARTVPRDQWPIIMERRRAETTRMWKAKECSGPRLIHFVDDAGLTGDWMGHGGFEAYARDGLGTSPGWVARMYEAAVYKLHKEPFEDLLQEMRDAVLNAPATAAWGDHFVWRIGVLFGLVDEDDEEARVPEPEPILPWDALLPDEENEKEGVS